MPYSSRTMTPADWKDVKHFRPDEFRYPSLMGLEFIRWLDLVRVKAGVPMTITSSARDEAYNASVGGATDSAHTDLPCNAVDIGGLTNHTRFQVVAAAIQLGCTRIGMYANGSLHLDRSEDVRPSPRLWNAV